MAGYAGYTKLFNSILHSTIWSESLETKIVWITMLAMCDKDGAVYAAIPGLARTAGVTVEQTDAAIARFQQPDKYSRTPDFEGRRIEPIKGGWRLLNHAAYRELMNEDDRREYNRLAKQKERDRKRQNESNLSAKSLTVNDKSVVSAHTDTDTDTDTDTEAVSAALAPKSATVTKETSTSQKTAMPSKIDKIPKVPKEPAQENNEEIALNGWAIWIDANRDLKRKDPAPVGPALSAAKRIAKLYQSRTELQKHFRRFLRDEDKFIVGRGFQLVDFEKNIEKYRQDPPKVQKLECDMTCAELWQLNPLSQNDKFEDEFNEKGVPKCLASENYIPGIFVYEGEYIRRLLPGCMRPEGVPDDLYKILRKGGSAFVNEYERRIAWHLARKEIQSLIQTTGKTA